jgi:hypothetical protein
MEHLKAELSLPIFSILGWVWERLQRFQLMVLYMREKPLGYL